jgi:2-polyprenyl-6-methoxyphenol hydroxylase-like FAD-dependent oxidoreductase
MSGTVDRALVIGSSIAGLLAAQALSEAYAEVIVLDRDDLPYGPVPRGGVPQIRHAHGLLAGGREAMEALLPGLTADLVAAGAIVGDAQEAMLYYVGTRRYASGSSGLTAVAVSRVLLEWTIRRRVAETPGVVFYDRSSVLDLMFSEDGRRVTGLVVASVDRPGSPRRLEADLVVDASGRTSRTPEWLERRGFQPPEEERVRCDLSYATRRFRRRPGDAGTALAIFQSASAAVPRSGLLVAQERDEWIAGVTGYHGVRPPTELSEFLAYARTLEGPALATVLERLEPLDDGFTYRFPASVRRRYERLVEVPDGLLVIGDALCSFDPAFGQGMSTAALEAVALRTCLTEGREDLGLRFFYRAAHHIDTPWQIVVGGMPPAPGTSVHKPLSERLVSSYLTALRYAAVDDPKLARAFLRVAHMTASPQSLMTPGNAARVFGRVLLNRAAAAGPAPLFGPPVYGLGHGLTQRPRPLAAVPSAERSMQPPGRRGPVHHRTGHVS